MQFLTREHFITVVHYGLKARATSKRFEAIAAATATADGQRVWRFFKKGEMWDKKSKMK
jgi:hypothetical protein